MNTRRARPIFSFIILLALILMTWVGYAPPLRAAAAPSELRVCNSAPGFYTSIQAAVDAAQPGDTIKVAAGTYKEGPTNTVYNLYITKTVSLLGGFTCADWTDRSPSTHVTTITPFGPDISVVAVIGINGQTAQVAPSIDGFTITGGGGGNHGGGIRSVDSNAIIQNNTISNNIAYLFGGGIWVQRGSPLIQKNLIENNQVSAGGTNYGGGIELEDTTAIVLNNGIASNTLIGPTGYGGGIAVEGGGPVTISNNIISNNVASTLAGGPADFSYGGGVSIENAPVTMDNNTIQGNTANQDNNPATVSQGFGGGVFLNASIPFSLSGNTIQNNAAGYSANVSIVIFGGGLDLQSSNGSLIDNQIFSNIANRSSLIGDGAGLAVLGSDVTIQGGQIASNKTSVNCEGYGGGIYAGGTPVTIDAVRINNNCADNTPFYGLGSGVALIASTYTITNTIINNNQAFPTDTAVGGVYADKTSPGTLTNNTIVNNNGQGIHTLALTTYVWNTIIMGQTTGIGLVGTGAVAANYNDLFANTANTSGFTLNGTNLTADPLLDAQQHLSAGSPAIDAGFHSVAPATDFDGDPRPMMGSSGLYAVDIGADEFKGLPQNVLNLDKKPADLTIIGPGGGPDHANSISNNDYIGYSVLGIDLNQDGKTDLLTAAEDWTPDVNNAPFSTGRLFGLFNTGRRQTGTIDFLNTTPDLTFTSDLFLQHIGSALATGDLNGDGKKDLIFGSYQDDNAGGGKVFPTVFGVWGKSSLKGTYAMTAAAPADFRLVAPGQDFYAFSAKNALATADVNGDGIDDLIVGDALANDGALTGAGAVFVIFGSKTLNGLHDLGTTPADLTIYGPSAGAGLGQVATGRLDAGNNLDLAVRSKNTAYIFLGPQGPGAIHLSTALASITVTGLQPGGIAVMDLNGDGQDDLILGSGGSLYVIDGPLTAGKTLDAATVATLTLTGAAVETFAAGDVVGDSHNDLILGEPGLKQALVIEGGFKLNGVHSILDAAQTVVSGNVKFLGQDVSTGDLDGDGRADLIVGSYDVDVLTHPANYTDAGEVFVFYSPSRPKNFLPLLFK